MWYITQRTMTPRCHAYVLALLSSTIGPVFAHDRDSSLVKCMDAIHTAKNDDRERAGSPFGSKGNDLVEATLSLGGNSGQAIGPDKGKHNELAFGSVQLRAWLPSDCTPFMKPLKASVGIFVKPGISSFRVDATTPDRNNTSYATGVAAGVSFKLASDQPQNKRDPMNHSWLMVADVGLGYNDTRVVPDKDGWRARQQDLYWTGELFFMRYHRLLDFLLWENPPPSLFEAEFSIKSRLVNHAYEASFEGKKDTTSSPWNMEEWSIAAREELWGSETPWIFKNKKDVVVYSGIEARYGESESEYSPKYYSVGPFVRVNALDSGEGKYISKSPIITITPFSYTNYIGHEKAEQGHRWELMRTTLNVGELLSAMGQ